MTLSGTRKRCPTCKNQMQRWDRDRNQLETLINSKNKKNPEQEWSGLLSCYDFIFNNPLFLGSSNQIRALIVSQQWTNAAKGFITRLVG